MVRYALVPLAAVVLAAAAPLPAALPPGAVPVTLRAAPGTALDAAARRLSAPDVADAQQAGERPLVLVGSARLGPASEPPFLFVQVQSPRECGSAGCSTTGYRAVAGGWRKVLDSVSGPIAALPTRHAGFADLKVGDDRYAWNGSAYASLSPGPALDLRGAILQHQAAQRARARAVSRRPRPAHPTRHPTSSPAHTAPAPPA